MSWRSSDGRPRRFSRRAGCLIWLIAALALLILLASLFGGFHKGTKVTGAAGVTAVLAG
jgi:hypothetical protein